MPIIDMEKTINVHGKKHKIQTVLGYGRMTTAYHLKSGRVLCVVNDDPTKQILLRIQRFNNPHIPKLRKISTRDEEVAYRMPQYVTLSEWDGFRKKPVAYKLGETLRDEYWNWSAGFSTPSNMTSNERLLCFVNHLKSCDDIPDSIADAIWLMVKASQKFSRENLGYDMTDGNLATTLDGQTLILLDAFTIR